MDTAGPELTCPRGRVGLSPHLREQLIAAFFDPGVQEPPRPSSVRIGGTWFCPRDREPMVEANGIIGCPRCGRSLNRYVYELIERYNHPRLAPDQRTP
jgi:hypothetical protein